MKRSMILSLFILLLAACDAGYAAAPSDPAQMIAVGQTLLQSTRAAQTEAEERADREARRIQAEAVGTASALSAASTSAAITQAAQSWQATLAANEQARVLVLAQATQQAEHTRTAYEVTQAAIVTQAVYEQRIEERQFITSIASIVLGALALITAAALAVIIIWQSFIRSQDRKERMALVMATRYGLVVFRINENGYYEPHLLEDVYRMRPRPDLNRVEMVGETLALSPTAAPEPVAEPDHDNPRALVIKLIRDAEREVGPEADKIPGWRKIPGWSSGPWQSAVHWLVSIGAVTADKTGTKLTARYDCLFDLEQALNRPTPP